MSANYALNSAIWSEASSPCLVSLGFVGSKSDASLFVYRHGSVTAYLLVYVDDIILTTSSAFALVDFTTALSRAFDIKDLGSWHCFLDISVHRNSRSMFLSQRKYMEKILTRTQMTNWNPCSTPVDTSSKLSSTSGLPVTDRTMFRSPARALQYLTFTRPDNSYAIQQLWLFMHGPRAPHLATVKCVLRYIKDTLDHGLTFLPSPDVSLTAYS